LQRDWVYFHPAADQDLYSCSDVHSYPHAPAYRVDRAAHQRYLGLR
jgi:hypothetical protein